MDSDRKTLWISYSAIKNFDNCSRLYYFTSIYRNPKTGNRVQIVNPYLSLGSAVHEAIDDLLDLAPSKRANTSLVGRLEKAWVKYEGKRGGFVSKKQESEFKERGVRMIKKVEGSPLLSARSLKKEKELPKMSLFDGVDLVGSFDWIELLPDNSLHIIDFKTGRSREDARSLQLPIYEILAKKSYGKKVGKLSYWYLEDKPKPTPKKSIGSIAEIERKAIEIKKAVDGSEFSCDSKYPRCFWCRKYESVISGRAEFIGTDDERQKDLFYLASGDEVIKKINEGEFLNEEEKMILNIRMSNGSSEEVREVSKKSRKQMGRSISDIKVKIKENLSARELKVFVEELSKNGNKIES